jgi:malate dehydrogenase (oxaloacetate-decarboxylating)(NADP+)
MANPDPEITYTDAKDARSDVIMATGRSDYPNQVNNVLGFPFIFRGALDVRARAINNEMKMAASHALAKLAKEDVPESVLKAYGVSSMSFGREYLIPKPFDPRVLTWEAPAVAKAACDTGVAKHPITDWDAYREQLERMLGPSRKVMHFVVRKARNDTPRRIVFPEGEHDAVIRAARDIVAERIAMPVLLGREAQIRARALALGIEQADFEIVNVPNAEHEQEYAEALYKARQRKGVTLPAALDMVKDPTIYGLMMVHLGQADGFVGGMYKAYPETIKPAIQLVGLKPGVSRVSAAHVLVLKDRVFFCADTMVNINPTAEELAEIALLAADLAQNFNTQPKVALLAFSSFGSVPHPISKKAADAVDIVRRKNPGIIVEGEMHLDTAVVEEIVTKNYPHSLIKGDANVLIFPDLTSGNIGYKLVQRLGGADAIGPILMGMQKPVNVLQHGMTVSDIVNVAAITAVSAEMQARPAVKGEPVLAK